MVTEKDMPVKYTKYSVTITTYDTGIADWDNVELCYRGESLREKVVCRLDACKFLDKYFLPSTIEKYRPVLMMIMKGIVSDPNTLSKCIYDLIDIDEVFREQIVHMFHSCPEDTTFGVYIIKTLADTLINAEINYRNFFRGLPQTVICISDGYLYFSVEDKNNEALLPDKVECEVLSYAKNWRGVFKYL